MRHPDRHLRLAAGAVLLGALWLHPWAAAQDDPRALGSAGIPPGGRFAGHSVTDFPRVRHLVERAERDVAEGLYDAAFEAIQEVIDRYPNQIYHAPDGIYHGARQYCIGILGGLPPEGRAAYRARYDRAAGRLFRRAAAEQDLEGLHEIVRRFLFTSWGPKALERLARLYHERGEWEEAAYYYRRAIEARGDEAPSPEALVRIATCLARAGDLEGARAAAERIARIAPDARVRVAGKDEAAGASARGILERARKRAALPPPGDAWPQLAGDPTHTRLAPPYPGPWTNGNVVPLGFPLLEPTTDRRVFMTRRFLPDISDMPPPFQPVIDGAVAFVHDGLLLEAINLYNGKRKWEYASLDEPTALPHPRITFAAACAGGVVYAPLETHVDEELIDYNYTPIRLPLPRRKLHAFDEETGTLLWSHADPPAAPPPPASVPSWSDPRSAPPRWSGVSVCTWAPRTSRGRSTPTSAASTAARATSCGRPSCARDSRSSTCSATSSWSTLPPPSPSRGGRSTT